MAEDLVFPRIVYRGEPDTLGLGLVGETARVDTAEELDAAVHDGWRLTSALPVVEAPAEDAPKRAAKK